MKTAQGVTIITNGTLVDGNNAQPVPQAAVVVRDGPGFWVNRLLTPYLNEAAFLYAEGVPVETLDGALERFGLPMGPLALLDEVGLDVAAKVGRVMAQAFPDRMRPHALLHRLEATGRLGTKSGRGFYIHEDGHREVDRGRPIIAKHLCVNQADDAASRCRAPYPVL